MNTFLFYIVLVLCININSGHIRIYYIHVKFYVELGLIDQNEALRINFKLYIINAPNLLSGVRNIALQNIFNIRFSDNRII